MKQLLFILNPTAGQKKGTKRLSEIISIFNRADYDVHVHITAQRGDATDIVVKLGASMDLIVCCGGDGTFNETMTGIIQANLDVPLGYIPAGSTNDFAHSLKLETDILKAAEKIVSGEVTVYDVGKYDDRYFSYVASFGMFTRASYSTPQSLKNSLGHMAYILSSITELSKIHKEHVRLELDDEVLEDDYIFGAISNSTSVGGILTLDPSIVDMSDGKFEVFVVRSPKSIGELREFIVSVINKSYKCRMITIRSSSKVKITTNPEMSWSLDGEQAGGTEVIDIENLHGRIKLVH